MIAGASMNWPQLMHGDSAVATQEQKEVDKTYYLPYSDPDSPDSAETTTTTPASTILGWLAGHLGPKIELGHPV